jgi:hypothetical protein
MPAHADCQFLTPRRCELFRIAQSFYWTRWVEYHRRCKHRTRKRTAACLVNAANIIQIDPVGRQHLVSRAGASGLC